MLNCIRLSLAVVILATGTPRALAQGAPSGLIVEHEAAIAAPPAKVYSALVRQVGMWWSPQHTFSGDSRNLSIDARPGGCFCEKLPSGGGVEHLRVIHVAPNALLRLSGALGPLQPSGVAGSLTWKLTSAGKDTSVAITYAIGGYMKGGFEPLAEAVKAVLLEQLLRLKSFVETGKPT